MKRINLTETKTIKHPNGIKILNLGSGHDMYGTHRADFSKGKGINYIIDLEEPLPFEDDTFNEIRLWRVLEHIKNIGQLIDECYRVLKKNGKLDIITDNAGYLPFYVKTEHNEWNDRVRTSKKDNHYHLFVASHLDRLLKRFRNRKITYPKFKKKLWKYVLLYYLLPFKLGYSELRIIGRK